MDSKVAYGRLRIIKFFMLGYLQPQVYAQRLGHPDSYWMNYSDYLTVSSENVFWTAALRHNLTCADTGRIRLVMLDDSLESVANVQGRTPLIGGYFKCTHAATCFLTL